MTQKPSPRAWTEDETREKFLAYILALINYWDTQAPESYDCRAKLEGLAFSILSTLDGGSIELPGFTVSPAPHESDREWHIGLGENWFDESVDISGCLHELLFREGDRKGKWE